MTTPTTSNNNNNRVLVAGATGHVGSQVVKILLDKGYYVRALVRRPSSVVLGLSENFPGTLEYAVGSLEDRASLIAALQGNIDTVVSSANGIIPNGKTMSVQSMSDDGYENFISAAEEVGTVKHWIQSSVPIWKHKDRTVPELAGKRLIERRLEDSSTIAATIVRNPAFTDSWMVMTGCKHAESQHPHATSKRPFGFSQTWQSMVGNMVVKHGILLAPGGRNHGAAFITTTDVANIMAGMVGEESSYDRIIEAGGPQWLTWGQVADLLSQKAGRKVRAVTMPAWFLSLGQALVSPFSSSTAGVLALVKLVASYQPRWEAPTVVQEFKLPEQTTVSQYLEQNWSAIYWIDPLRRAAFGESQRQVAVVRSEGG